MTTLLPSSCVGFAALCVWLAVRIVNRRERWAKWTLAAVIVVPVLYFASFGPACWICSRLHVRYMPTIYYPIGGAYFDYLAYIKGPFEQYARWGMARNSEVFFPVGSGRGGMNYMLMRSE